MRAAARRLVGLVSALVLLACNGGKSAGGASAPGAEGEAPVRLVEVAAGLDFPLLLTAPPGDPRLFVVEKGGRIKIVKDGRVLAEPFLDLSSLVSTGSEQGLLGLAFHPRYATNGRLFVNYTDRGGETRIVRYQASAGADRADGSSAVEILGIDQPFGNHNGGHVAFGPDGNLYIGMGDGGSGNDPRGYGQRLDTRLGKMLRIDVDGGSPYASPPDNPFAGRSDARPEIWAYGLRNPWRFSFDRETGDLYIGDVGQNAREEVDVAPGNPAGLNYGWAAMEASICRSAAGCEGRGFTLPLVEYATGPGGTCSVTGGYVYRGSAIPALQGTYFYSDYCAGWVRSFRLADGRATDLRVWPSLEPGGRVPSFGEDGAGELYILTTDAVYRIAPR